MKALLQEGAESAKPMGFHSHGDTPQWMVYNGKSENKLNDLGVPLFQETLM